MTKNNTRWPGRRVRTRPPNPGWRCVPHTVSPPTFAFLVDSKATQIYATCMPSCMGGQQLSGPSCQPANPTIQHHPAPGPAHLPRASPSPLVAGLPVPRPHARGVVGRQTKWRGNGGWRTVRSTGGRRGRWGTSSGLGSCTVSCEDERAGRALRREERMGWAGQEGTHKLDTGNWVRGLANEAVYQWSKASRVQTEQNRTQTA
jgi:hypothetical protein